MRIDYSAPIAVILHITYWRRVQSEYTRAGISWIVLELFVPESHHLQWANSHINKRKGDRFEEGLESTLYKNEEDLTLQWKTYDGEGSSQFLQMGDLRINTGNHVKIETVGETPQNY